MKLNDKVSIITGGAGGIGKSIALFFVKEGARVVIVDTDKAKGEKAVKEILIRYSNKANFIKADVSNSTEVNEMAEKVLTQFNKIDV
ncbi:SDR family NAD(P)-dependent oxidoreductase, partial [bacterium]|nr:SDR family NAD(P)-dependent oxidoreductase [bacterium]